MRDFSLLLFQRCWIQIDKHIYNGCHDLFTMAHSLKDVVILSARGNTFRCLLTGISKKEGLKRLNNSVIYDRGVLLIWILY